MKLLKKINNLYSRLLDANKIDDYELERAICYSIGRELRATRAYYINCTGDACRGDEVLFLKKIWDRVEINRHGKLANRIVDYQWVEGTIINDSYGEEKQQHTFTILLKKQRGKKMLIKGRNLYGICCFRKRRDDNDRDDDLSDKHARGAAARAARYDRQSEYQPFYMQ